MLNTVVLGEGVSKSKYIPYFGHHSSSHACAWPSAARARHIPKGESDMSGWMPPVIGWIVDAQGVAHTESSTTHYLRSTYVYTSRHRSSPAA
jgi:hypothetical protein